MAREWPRHGNSPAPRPAEVDAEGYDDPESALLNIIAHTAHDEHAPRELLAGLLASVLRIADAALARLRSEPSTTEREPDGFRLHEAMELVGQGMEKYARDHPKWWKRINHTPIPNDLKCVIARAVWMRFGPPPPEQPRSAP